MAPKQSALKRPASALKRPASAMKRPAAAVKRPAAAPQRPVTAAAAGKGSRAAGKKRPAPAGASRAPPAKKAAATAGSGSKGLASLPALLLGMERRPDRRERCEAMLKKEVPWLGVEFFRATDGKADVIPEEEVSRTWNTKNNALYGAYEDVVDKGGKMIHTAAEFADPGVDYEFSPGERGCAHSHYRMWQRAAEAEGPTLILEDDVQLEFKRSGAGDMSGEVFTARLQLGMEEAAKRSADVLYLGWAGFREGNLRHLKPTPGRKSGVVRRAEYVWTTVAYVIWPAGARKLLEQAKPMNQPVDNFMGWESREGRLSSWVLLDEGDTDDTWSGGIVTQLDFIGDSDIKKSDGGDQGHDPTEFLAKQAPASTLAQPQEGPADAATEAPTDAPGETSDTAVAADNAEGGVAGDAKMVAASGVSVDTPDVAPDTDAAAEEAEGGAGGDVEMADTEGTADKGNILLPFVAKGIGQIAGA